jgi:hypothetical protein
MKNKKRRIKKFSEFSKPKRVIDTPYTYVPVGNLSGPNPVPVFPITTLK